MNSNEQLLLSDMKDLFPSFKCNLQDIRTPTEEFVTDFYSYWLQEFEVDINNVFQVQFNQAAVIGCYQDAFSGLLPKINLLRCIRAFEIVPEFNMLDIVSPTPKRTQSILRSFINFYKWADNNIGSIREKRSVLIERRETIAKMLKEREDLKENLNAVIKNIGQLQDTKIKLEEDLKELQQQSSELRLEKQVLKSKVDEANEKFKEVDNTLQKLNREDSMVANQIKEYSSLIVDSPSGILTDVDNLRVKSEEKSELQNQKRDMVEAKMQAHNKLQKALEAQEKRATELDEVLKLIDQHRELLQTVSAVEKSTNACQEELKELKSLLIALSNKKGNRQEALQSLYLKWKTLKPQLVEHMESAIRELTDKKSAKNKMISSLNENSTVQEKIDTLLKLIKTHVEDFENDRNALNSQQEEAYAILESKLASNLKNLQD